jgi:SAM-dependent methyltransferase
MANSRSVEAKTQQTKEQVREHYQIERSIADRLKNSSADERSDLYAWAYDKLFSEVSHHPMLNTADNESEEKRVNKQIGNISRFLKPDLSFAEIGPGNCSLSIAVAEKVKAVYAIDVSSEITGSARLPENLHLILSDGVSVPAPEGGFDFVYSNQLMEHLHPDDAINQLKNVCLALRPRGIYYCTTPNRLTGPHDVSRSFDDVATGLHLKEYSIGELDELFKTAGFSTVKVFVGVSRFGVELPVMLFRLPEKLLDSLPHRLRKLITFNRVLRFLMGVKLVGYK